MLPGRDRSGSPGARGPGVGCGAFGRGGLAGGAGHYGHSARPIKTSGSQVAMPGKTQRITMPSAMHST